VVSHGFGAVGVLASGLFVPYLFPLRLRPTGSRGVCQRDQTSMDAEGGRSIQETRILLG
jgi:hypothetical protein